MASEAMLNITSASDIERIAVIGAGLMGHGIALELAAHGYDVRLHDQDQARLERVQEPVAEGLARLVAAGRITPATAEAAPARIAIETDLRAATADADLVIEAVYENLDLKRSLFRDLDAWAPPRAILASNTSSFMPRLLGAATNRPDRVLVAHYFNPPHLLPLVELVRGEQTSDATLATMRDFYEGIGKSPVVIQHEAPGFVGNRMQMALLREALAIVEAGIATPQDIDTIITSGFGRRLAAAGIFEVFDAAGWDVTLAVADQLFPVIDRATAAPESVRAKVARGELGVKSGKGFYDWPPDRAEALRQRIGNALTAIARLASDADRREESADHDSSK
jgi:3-hydroxyacyl-CoA dehydrogenase